MTVNGNKYEIDILKLKAGAIKRYTQPGTETRLIGTAAFHDCSICWQLNNDYFIEFKLRSKYIKQLLPVDEKKKTTDVARWWFQNYGVYGLMQFNKNTDSNKKNNGNETKGLYNHNGMKLKPYFAAHHNDMVGGGDLNKSLKRIEIVLHQRNTNKIPTEFRINGELIEPICFIKTENGQHLNNRNNNGFTLNAHNNNGFTLKIKREPNMMHSSSSGSSTENEVSQSNINTNNPKTRSKIRKRKRCHADTIHPQQIKTNNLNEHHRRITNDSYSSSPRKRQRLQSVVRDEDISSQSDDDSDIDMDSSSSLT